MFENFQQFFIEEFIYFFFHEKADVGGFFWWGVFTNDDFSVIWDFLNNIDLLDLWTILKYGTELYNK